jgi:TctA family transporter
MATSVLRRIRLSPSSVILLFTLVNLADVDKRRNTLLYPGEYKLMLNEPMEADIKLLA